MSNHSDLAAVFCGEANPVLAVRTRSGVAESVHRGSVCAVRWSRSGPVTVLARGNLRQTIYPRSALKYVQVLPLLESGAVQHFGFSDAELAVMCASHYAQPVHLATVRNILKKIGCSEADLRCGGHAPGCETSMYQYIRDSVTIDSCIDCSKEGNRCYNDVVLYDDF